MMEIRSSAEGFTYFVFPEFLETGIVSHLFSTRVGGVSAGPFSACNFSYTRGDRKDAVDENYRRAVRALFEQCTSSGGFRAPDGFRLPGGDAAEGAQPDPLLTRIVLSQQTHTKNLRVVTEEDTGKGTVRPRDYTDIDGLLTNVPGLVLATQHADCTPIYLVDPVRRAVALVHSGWKGTVLCIADEAVRLMQKTYGTDPADLLAGIGPVISRDYYEIGAEVAAQLDEVFGRDRCVREGFYTEGSRKDHFQLDLTKTNTGILTDAGVLPEHIFSSGLCTYSNPDLFFSHRFHGTSRGNNAAFLMLNPQ